MISSNDDRFCDACSGRLLVQPDGTTCCSVCGLIHGQVFEGQQPFSPREDGGTSRDGHGLGSSFCPSERRDGKGSMIDPEKRASLLRIHRVDTRAARAKHRSLDSLERAVRELATRLEMPDSAVRRAQNIAVTAWKEGVVRGRPYAIVAAACIAIATKALGVSRPVREITALLPTSPGLQGRTNSMRKRIINGLGLALPPIDPASLVPAVVAQLALPPAGVAEARRILEDMQRQEPPGSSPFVLVAAATYLAARRLGVCRTQAEVSAVCHVSEVALRQHMRE